MSRITHDIFDCLEKTNDLTRLGRFCYGNKNILELMAQITALLNGENINQDYQITALARSLINP